MNDSLTALALLEKIENLLKSALKDDLYSTDIVLGELVATVRKEAILHVLAYLRDQADLQFSQLMDICGVDYPDRAQRFEVIYHLLSLKYNIRIRVKAQVGEGESVPSVIGVFNSAGWWEREAWDLYGIPFAGHPDLRRILTDYGFEGHPLRKDFPLTGFVELRYDETQRRVIYEPVELMQAYRNFDFLSPWEGPNAGLLPGDEKANADRAGE